MSQHTPGPCNREDTTGGSGKRPDWSSRPGSTPGPWEIRQAANGRISVYPLGGKERVLDVYCPLDVDGGTLSGNARLIAKAPELLAWLQAFTVDYAPNPMELAKYRASARALLREIEGETP